MPANSGSISGTVAHKHSVPSGDGGQLSEGVTNYTGGIIHEVLTNDGTDVPVWAAIPAAGGGGGWEFVEEFVLGSTQVYFTSSFASAISLAAYNVRIDWFLKNDSISSNMEMKINTESGYFINGGANSGITVSGGVQIPANSWCIGSLQYFGNDVDDTRTMGFMTATHGSTGGGETFGIRYEPSFVMNASITEINAIQFFPTNGDQYINNYVRVYKMATS